jgi:hypothetical protein
VDTWAIVIAVVVVGLPLVLMQLFNRGDVADSRGRRRNSTWRTRRQRI